MNILGVIACDVGGHPSACLMKSGRLIAFAEEERFVRVKQAKGYFPSHSIRFCLKQGGLALRDIDYIAFGWDANVYKFQFPFFLAKTYLQRTLWNKHSEPGDPISSGRPNLGAGVLEGMMSLIGLHPKKLTENIVLGLKEAGYDKEVVPKVLFLNHHKCHAATAFYCSGFDEAGILIFDGHGEESTISIYKGAGRELSLLQSINIPDSLGWFYSAFTEYLGWNPNEGEVKLMGLAPYGSPNPEIKAAVDRIVVLTQKGITLNTDYIFYYKKRSFGKFFSDLLVNKFGLPRSKYEDITQCHRDIAYAVQARLEEAALHLAGMTLNLAQSRNLCLAGGIALNCKMNGLLHKSNLAEHIFVQPLAYDAGVSLGAAMLVAVENNFDCRFKMEHLYFGPEYSNNEIEKILKRNKIKYRFSQDIAQEGAAMIAGGRIIGWFQGRMEGGPRALGHRSILADPRDPNMKNRVNALVKFREDWRPFAISILDEYKENYLENPVPAPFMIMAFDVPEDKWVEIPSGIHQADNTTRPQTVSRPVEPLYWELIDQFRKLTGVPLILNTSFNVKDEPIVCNPDHALRCFFSTGLDALIMGNFIIEK